MYSVNINKRSTSSFDVVHSDVWHALVVSGYDHRYFTIFIDDAIRVTWMYSMKSKYEVFIIFKTYNKLVEVQFGKKIEVFKSDNGGEYTSQVFQMYWSENGIESQMSCAYTP